MQTPSEGTIYGRLSVIKEVLPRHHGKQRILCRCACGGDVVVRLDHAMSGATQSCGCLQKERAYEASATHGLSKSREYKIWRAMINRCYNERQESYPRYGGRGITVCDEWRASFEAFYAALGQRPSSKHSLDRIDTDGRYEPNNCKWSTAKEQGRNKRTNRHVTFRGDTMTMAELAERFAMDPTVLAVRLRCGWSLEEATSTPVLPRLPARVDGITANPSYSDEELRNDYARVVRLLNHAPSISEYKQHGSYSHMTLWRRFGSWRGVSAAWA